MSTVTRPSPAFVARSSPALVSSVASSLPEACISSQAAQRLPLPQASISPPSAFQNRTKASARADGPRLMSWSQPTPVVRSQIARASSSVGSKGSVRASTTTKSLPRPFIFTKGRLMGCSWAPI